MDQADSPMKYLVHGWRGDEDEDVDVDSSGGSSEEEIDGLKQNARTISTAARQTVDLKQVLDFAETSVQGTSNAGGQECDPSATKSRTERVRTSRDFEQKLKHTVDAKQVDAKNGLKEPGAPGENSGAKGIPRLQPRKFSDGKRLDARRFRDHFAAKLVGSRRANIAEGNGQGEVSNALRDKSVSDGALEPSKGESPQQAGSKEVKDGSIGIEEEGVVLHVNLEVEQEKGVELPCNGECNTANKESFQVFTRKRKQASEGATQNEKVLNQNSNGVQVETIDESSSEPKVAEGSADKPPESPKSNTISGRSKRARKHNRQTDYIPWSDFGRLSAKKSDSHKSVDSATGTENDSKRTGSKGSLENRPEDSTSLSKEIKVSAHPSSSQNLEVDERDGQKDSQNSFSLSVVVEKEHVAQAPTIQIDSSCTTSGKELEVQSNKCARSSIIQDKDDQQASEVDAAEMQDGAAESCYLSNGAMDSAQEMPMQRREVLQNKSVVEHDVDINPTRHPDPKAQEQLTHEAPSTSSRLHSREDSRLLIKEGSEMLNDFSCRQEGVVGVEPPKGMATDNHDSVCNKCKQEGQLICCDGKDCKITFHIDCLDPPLRDAPPNDWYCPRCACKRIFGGMHSVSKGIESIWDVKSVNDGSDRGTAQPEVRVVGDVRQPQAHHGTRAVSDADRIVANALEKGSPNLVCAERLYFVKYKGVAHAHNLWLAESQVSKEAPKLLINYKKQVEQGKAPKWDPEWVKPFRVIGKRKTMLAKLSEVFPTREDGVDVGHCIEWCIKWKNLGYEACTWEPADKTPVDSAFSKKLIADYELRSAKAAQCRHAEDTCTVEAHFNPSMLAEYHQNLSEVIEKLLYRWKKHTSSIVVNEIHQDRMRTAIAFLVCLIEKFAVSKPCCVVVSPLLLGEWKAAFKKWMPNANVVLYGGSKEARNIIQRYEFYNDKGLCTVQIILTSSDTLNLDMENLKELSFEALIIDECQRLKGTKSSKSLRQFASPYRLLLLGEPIKNNTEDYHYILQELAGGKDDTPQEENATLMQLKTLVSKHIVQEAKQESSSPMEFWVPVKMTAFQLQQYCTLLIEKCDSLVRGKRGDIASSPQELLLKLRECCNHPFLVKPGFQESLTYLSAKELLDFGIGASGKLKLLDMMLGEAKSSNKRVLVITQINLRAGKVSLMDVLDDYMRQQFGIDSYERLDGGVEKSKKSAAVQRFNALTSKCFVFLLDRRACGSAIKLRSVNCIVIFDSDWNPQTDIQSLLRMYSPGELEDMRICRFYCTHTVEERVLISARRHSDLDSNHHNFTLALCQKLLRWGASKNFELFDTFSRDKVKPTDEVMYSAAMIDHFLGKGDVQSLDELCAVNSLWETALFPRRANEYSKGLPLFEEKNEELAEEERISATEFWSDLLKDRQVEAPDVQVRELRTRKRVQYHEDSFDVSNTSHASAEEEEESRRKKRKVAEVSDFSTVARGGRSSSVERSPIMGVGVHSPTVENLERSQMSRPVESVDKAPLQRPKPSAGEVAHSPSRVDKNRTGAESKAPSGEPESTDNEAINDPTAAAKAEQQQALLSMKADLDKLCQALQFQADTAGHVEQLLFSVGNFFKLPKEKSLLHAVELSLCWLAAEQQHYCIDRDATLLLAESCFGVQLDKIGTVYAKLEERWKKRLEQGVQQSQGTRGQDKEVTIGGEQDRVDRAPDREPPGEKHGSSQAPTDLGSLEGSHIAAQESSAPGDVQLPTQGVVTSGTRELHQGSAALPLEGQVPVEQVQICSTNQASAPQEPLVEGHNLSLPQQQRNERSQLINVQKNQIAALEQLERKYKQKIKQHYESALAKFPRTASSEEQSKLLEGWRSASNVLSNSFRVIRNNLVKYQYEERGKEHRLPNSVHSIGRNDDFNEESIYKSFPQWLRTAIETGDFESARGLDLVNCAPPNTSQGSLVPNLPDPQPVSLALNIGTNPIVVQGHQGVDLLEPSMHVAPNVQQQRHLHQRQVQDSVLQQQRRPSTIPSDPVYSRGVSSSALQNQHVTQRLPVTYPQPLPVTSAPRPSSPILLPQQVSLSQAPPLPQQPQLVSDIQRGVQIPPRFGPQPSSGNSLTLTLPNEVSQPPAASGALTAAPSSGRVVSGGTSAANRILQSGQQRSNQQYQNDPLAQEFLRLRKEQDKLKTLHESEKDRIKAQFMKELELLSKKYEVMLQEEDSTYSQKASALESNLKKVEMNRRLAEVFRLKNAQEGPALNSVAAGQEFRVQGQNYQQYPTFVPRRSPLTTATAGLQQTSTVATVGGPLFEWPARVPSSSITGAQLAGAFTSPLWHYSQGLTSNIVAGPSPHSVNAVSAVGVLQSRSVLSTSAPGSYIETFRMTSPVNVMQRAPANTAMISTTAVSTSHGQELQGLNVAPVGSFVHGASNLSVGGSLGGIPTSNILPNTSSAMPRGNSTRAVAGSIALDSAAQTLAGAQQDNHLLMGSLSSVPLIPGNTTESHACDALGNESSTPFLANNEEPQGNESRCTISTTQVNNVHANPEAVTTTTFQAQNVQNHVINGLGTTQSRHLNEGQDRGPSDVICLSDDD
ncbi:hypothetical protein GOP47_0011205 [Adiantum capillus-veneris]|uniref:Uncharacterized protein n=1 Tax=Adiantum capillus-veneris TaxID=13818 RepID=A0A9D4ZGH7_ADICA|nr:hypothetical protein GOP47_0011205 [Adiantum capillus-veneris]